jgi:metallo-beta-lactamase family protein
VRGSCHRWQVGNRRIALSIQGSRKEETRNWGSFPFGPKRIDAMILSHARIDRANHLLRWQRVVTA